MERAIRNAKTQVMNVRRGRHNLKKVGIIATIASVTLPQTTIR
jgi:hypothetical protein